MSQIKPPKGFESLEARQKAVDEIVMMLEAYETDPEKVEKFARYDLTKDVYDDKVTMSSLEVIEDIDPYQIALLSTMVDNVVGDVAKAFDGAKPYFLFTGGQGGPDDELREAREHDTNLWLMHDKLPGKVAETAMNSALKAIGPFRQVWKTEKVGQGWMGDDDGGDSELAYAGPTVEPILPDDIRFYPLNQREVNKLRMIGHRVRIPMWEMRELKAAGEYFEDVEIMAIDSSGNNSVPLEDDFTPETYALNVKLMAPDGKMRAYRVTMTKDTRQMVRMEVYDLPQSDYFVPLLRWDPGVILPEHSVGSKCLEPQTLYNDSYTAQIIGAISAARPTVLASGTVGDMDTISIGMDKLITVRGAPAFTMIPSRFEAGQAMNVIAHDMQAVAEGSARTSRTGAGQLPESEQTATATGAALAGENESTRRYQENFLGGEWVRMVELGQFMIERHFQDFKRYHGKRLKTTKASDWKPKYDISPNGQGPSNNPAMQIEKVNAFVDAAAKLGIPIAEPQEGMPQKKISGEEALNRIAQALDLDTEKLYVDEIVPPEVPPLGVPEDGGGPLGAASGAESILADPGVLAQLLGSLPPELFGGVGPGEDFGPIGPDAGMLPVGGLP